MAVIDPRRLDEPRDAAVPVPREVPLESLEDLVLGPAVRRYRGGERLYSRSGVHRGSFDSVRADTIGQRARFGCQAIDGVTPGIAQALLG
jgi:hypothetical protein